MSIITSSLGQRGQDHFVPETTLDPQAQRRLRGQLEQVDYAAFAANQLVVGKALGFTDIGKFERMAAAAAHARAHWVAAALAITENGGEPTAQQVGELRTLRLSYEELAEAYEAMRRMVERGYLRFRPKAP